MRAVIYARVSSDRQDVDLSISAQLKAVREYAAKNGYEVVREFVDEVETGRSTGRPAFQEMVSMARRANKPFDVILVWKLSRFARNREDSIVHKKMLKRRGVQLISITEPFDDSPMGNLMEGMIEIIDEFYSANLGREVNRGMQESASRGNYVKSYVPYGYRKVKVSDGYKERPKLVPEPHEAQIVVRMFQQVLEGKGLKEIVKGLNSEGIASPRNKKWIKTTIHQILTNETYTGTLVWGKKNIRNEPPVVTENAWPAIIDKDTFSRVQATLRGRSPAYLHPRRTASRFLLSGIAKCGHCGKAFVGHNAKGGKVSYYVCGTLMKQGSNSCPAKYVNANHFEGVVIDKIKEYILTTENLTELVRLVNEELDASTVEYHEKLNAITHEMAEVTRKLDNLYNAVETGQLELSDLAPRIKEQRQRQESLRNAKTQLELEISDKRVYLADMQAVTEYIKDIQKLLEESSLAEKRSFIKSFVQEVKVTGQEVLLTYTLPMAHEGTIETETAVLPTVQYGGQYWT